MVTSALRAPRGFAPTTNALFARLSFIIIIFFFKIKRSNVEAVVAVEAVEGRNEILWNENDDDNKRGGSGILTLLTLHPPHTHTF